MPQITLHGQMVTYEVSYSQRAKHARLRLDARRGLWVILPAGSSIDPTHLLQHHADWVMKQMGRLSAKKPSSRTFNSGDGFQMLGQAATLLIKTAVAKAYVAIDMPMLEIGIPLAAGETPTGEQVRAALIHLYTQLAKQHFQQRVTHFAALYGLKVGQIRIREQRTRWGSCSSNGNLNFNWRLMQAPPAVVDYVVIHELCHLTHLNHSAQFWALVAARCPSYQADLAWLKQHGALLVW
jgi:predicted metal-dependent hydrolase